jgi:hypothetical protein
MVTTVGDDTEPKPSKVEPIKSAIRHYWIPLALALTAAATALAPVPFGVAGCFVLILVTYAVARVQAGEAVSLARLRRPISSAPVFSEPTTGPIT